MLPGAVWALAHRMARRLPGVDPEDLAQEAAVAIWRSGATDVALQVTIGRRRIIDVSRSITGRQPDDPRRLQAVELTRDVVSTGAGPEQQVVADEDAGELADSLAGLTSRERDLLLAVWRDETLDEASRRHGITPSRGSQIRSHVRARLRRLA